MSADIAINSWRKRISIPTNEFKRSGPADRWSFRDVPWYLAAASLTRRIFWGLWGCSTGWCGKYHARAVGSDDSRSDSFLMYPFWRSSSIVCLYLAFSSRSLSRRFSNKCKRFSATALLSGKSLFESLQISPTWYLPSTLQVVLSRDSKISSSSYDLRSSLSYLHPNDSVFHQVFTSSFSSSSGEATWMKPKDSELREYPGRVPVTVQASFVLIPNGEPLGPSRTSLGVMISLTSLPRMTLISALSTSWSSMSATTIFTTTRLFFSKHLWALCNTLPSIIPYMESVRCYRNWIELEGIKIAPNYPVNLR